MIHRNQKQERIDHLLERYYTGLSTIDEEMELYLLISGEPSSSPYYDDAQMLRLQFEGATSDRDKCPKSLLQSHRIRLSGLVASLLLMIGVGLWIHRSVQPNDLIAHSSISLPPIEIMPETATEEVSTASMPLLDTIDTGDSTRHGTQPNAQSQGLATTKAFVAILKHANQTIELIVERAS